MLVSDFIKECESYQLTSILIFFSCVDDKDSLSPFHMLFHIV